MSADEGIEAEGVVKWFNSVKGFGFVAVNNEPQDAFLHISVVTRAGLQGLAENTRILCMVAPSQRGSQITRIIQVLGVDQNAPAANNSRGDRGGDRGDRGNGGGFGGNFGGGFGGGHDDYGSGGFGGGFREERAAPSGPVAEVNGTVKWYKPDKGFGFAVPEDGGKDVFIHRSVLGKAGLDSIDPGRRIMMQVQSSNKGREAVEIRPLD